MTNTNIQFHTEPTNEGNGYIAVVTHDGDVLYDSLTKHGQRAGVFESEADAEIHAAAWAEAERQLDEAKEALRQRRLMLLGGEVLVLKAQAREDLEQVDKFKEAGKTSTANAAAREARIEALARHAEKPRLRIEWDHASPGGVQLVPEASAWDEEFVPEVPDDPRQLSIPGVSFNVTKDDGEIERVVGYGRLVLTVEDGGNVLLVLGNDEHRISIQLAEPMKYVEMEKPPAAAPKAGPKPSKEAEAKRGALGDAALRERLQHITRVETLLGLYILEQQHKSPRARVLKAITAIAVDHENPSLLMDLTALDDGRTTTNIQPDLAAAVIASSNAKTATTVLEQFVPDCSDSIVLGWVLDDELERGEHSRGEVVDVVRARLFELRPAATANDGEQTELPSVVH